MLTSPSVLNSRPSLPKQTANLNKPTRFKTHKAKNPKKKKPKIKNQTGQKRSVERVGVPKKNKTSPYNVEDKRWIVDRPSFFLALLPCGLLLSVRGDGTM